MCDVAFICRKSGVCARGAQIASMVAIILLVIDVFVKHIKLLEFVICDVCITRASYAVLECGVQWCVSCVWWCVTVCFRLVGISRCMCRTIRIVPVLP